MANIRIHSFRSLRPVVLGVLIVLLYRGAVRGDAVGPPAGQAVLNDANPQPGVTFNLSSASVQNVRVTTVTYADGTTQTTASSGGGGGGGGSTRYENNGSFALNSTTMNILGPLSVSNSSGKALLQLDTITANGVVSYSSASATYLTFSSATSNYVTISSVTSTYLTQSSAAVTYLNVSSASATYLQLVNGLVPNSRVDKTSVTVQGVAVSGQNISVTNGVSKFTVALAGIVPAANLPSTVPYTNSANTFTPTQNFNGGLITSTETISSLSPGVEHILAGSSMTATGLVSMSTETTGPFISSVNVSPALTTTANGANNTTITLGVNPSSVTTLGQNPPASSIASGPLGSGVIASSLTPTGVLAGTYGSASQVSTFTVNLQGQITGAANVAILISTSGLNATGATSSNFLRGDNTWATPAGGGGASSLEVFSNFGFNRSSPTASLGIGQSIGGTVSGSTYTINVNLSSVPVLGASGLIQNFQVDGSSVNKQGTILAGSNITLTPGAGTLTIAASASGSGTISTITAGTNIVVTNSTGPNVTVTLSTTIANPITFSSTTIGTFFHECFGGQATLPGSNSPFISNSTNETSAGIYFDDTSTQSTTCTFTVMNYDGRPLYADIVFHSTATSGTINFGVYTATNTPNVGGTSRDTLTYSTIVTTATTMMAPSNCEMRATIALTNSTTIKNRDTITVKFEREAGSNDSANGYARMTEGIIYE